MLNQPIPSRQRLVAWIIICVVVGTTFFLYRRAGLQPNLNNAPILPLDDAYIHFQYARAIAEGHPLRYNADQPPTSGATSLLYPLLLAVGYIIGFHGLNLAWWALLIGVACWLGCTWLLYTMIARRFGHWIGLLMAITFALTGSIDWAFMSGMETGLMLFATLLTLFYIVRDDRRGAILAGTLATLIRPEGVVIGLLAALYLALHEASRRELLRHLPQYVLPLLAALIQPTINLLTTGSLTASGLLAKSVLYNVPGNSLLINTIIGTNALMWFQLLTGGGPNSAYFTTIPFIIALISAALGLYWLVVRRSLSISNLIIAWMVGLIAVISTLETAFWQFKRYQQPVIALLFPLAAWGLHFVMSKLSRWRSMGMIAALVLSGLLLGNALLSTRQFVQNYADNSREIASSQMQMAQYVAATLPPGAIVGVHDIGVMRYLGDHPTYDVIGLTTPGAARAWRNGPGAVYEAMAHSVWRPGYFAIYNDALGLSYFAATGLMRDKLASFPSAATGPDNVASATTSGQAVYRADWTFAKSADQPHQPSTLQALSGLRLVDSVNVADLTSEDAHQYRWWNAADRPGFASEVYQQNYVACTSLPDNPTCTVLDGGRLITGGEEMVIATQPGQDLLWVTRIHPRNAARLDTFVNDQQVGTRLIPEIPGQWLEIATLIPGNLITGTQTRVRAVANITDPAAGHYMPYYHWFYQGKFEATLTIQYPQPVATFGGTIKLVGHRLNYDQATRTVTLDLEWQSNGSSAATIDAKTFIHLYDQAGKLLDGAQIDQRPGRGALPPANWLPGTLTDSYRWQVPDTAAPGIYRVAVGLYDPIPPNPRLTVEGQGSDADQRLFIGSIDVN